MNVTLCSLFRDSMGYLRRYIDQVTALGYSIVARGHRLYFVLGEGDSTDCTQEALLEFMESTNLDIVLVNVAHGGQNYGSVVHPQRFKQLAGACNTVWQYIPPDADAVIWCESDLIWQSETMLALLDDLAHVPAVSPMIELERDGWPKGYAYDRWAVWRNGVQIHSMPPYFDDLDDDLDLVELDSSGSCMAMRGDVARRVTWPPEDVFRGVSRQIREGGDSVYLDMRLKVQHP